MLTTHRWNAATRVYEAVPAYALPASAGDLPAEDVIWIDLADPTPEEEARVFCQFLPVHTLTLGDITKPRREPDQGAHLPKVEEFADYLFLVVNPLPPGLADPAVAGRKRARLRECPQLSAVLTRQVLVTHHYPPLACVDGVSDYVARHGDCARRGPDYVCHLILDAVVDEYAPVVDRVSDRLDRLEAVVFRHPTPKTLARLLRLKRLVSGMRKTLILEREVLARLTRGEFELVDQREIAYYRNVYDHIVRYTELVESAREMVSDLMESHLAAASNRLNQVMKLLTMISTIVLPMNLIAGVYGMNFEESAAPSYHAAWGFWFALSLMGVAGVVAFGFFRWRKWV
ncbi:MAG TPA: magnesium/cobalt transporter CorA [Urbifossiella sp.]|jgi:magnesium transporter|nr:magnesium/cobalt transporter CorA [Urbifossiella sp.]